MASEASNEPTSQATTHSSERPIVSVIVPLYNTEETVERLVWQLKAQLLDDFEAFLVDDGSTDNTLEAARSACAGDDRFCVLHQENAGPGVARNAGLERARGAYISFVDADDTISPLFLRHMVARAEETNADVAICRARIYIQAETRTSTGAGNWQAKAMPDVFAPAELADDLFGTFQNWLWNKLFRASFLVENGISFPPIMRAMDLAFTCSALASARTIALLDEQLYTYHVDVAGSATATRSRAPLSFFDSCAALKDYLDDHGLTDMFATTYAQWVSTSCAVNVAEQRSPEDFRLVYEHLHNGGLERLGLLAPRPEAQPLARNSAAGCLTDDDVSAVIDVVERRGFESGADELRAIVDEASWRGRDGQNRREAGVLLYPAGRASSVA